MHIPKNAIVVEAFAPMVVAQTPKLRVAMVHDETERRPRYVIESRGPDDAMGSATWYRVGQLMADHAAELFSTVCGAHLTLVPHEGGVMA